MQDLQKNGQLLGAHSFTNSTVKQRTVKETNFHGEKNTSLPIDFIFFILGDPEVTANLYCNNYVNNGHLEK